jgi:hypothetical protein
MAYTTINKSSAHFNTKLYTGNGGTNNITGVGFKPDWTWLKKRNGTANHHLVDSVRGVGYYLYANLTNAQGGNGSALLTSFNTDGFTLDAGANSNASGATGVSWNWKAGGTASSNTNGSITSSVSANPTAGFSIVSFTGTQANATIGHGLSSAPKMIIVKAKTQDDGWYVWNVDYNTSNNKYQRMETTGTLGAGTAFWNDTAPTSSVFSVGSSTGTNYNGPMIAYCFANVQGYSKMGGYIGNGNADGTFVYTGFKPTFVMFKSTATSESWQIYDTKRNPFNALGEYLNPNNTSAAGNNANFVDYLSNGFKLRTHDGGVNSSQLYIYMAFGQSLVGSNGVTAKAR